MPQFAEAGLCARGGDVLRLVVEGEGIGREGRGARGGCVGAEVVLGEGDGEGAVGWEVEFGVAFAPIPVYQMVSKRLNHQLPELRYTDLMTAMFTGAKVLAR